MRRTRSHKVSFPEPLQTWADERISRDGFSSAEECVRHLVRDDVTRGEREALEARLLEAMSGPKSRLTSKKREDIRKQYLNRNTRFARKRAS